MEVNVDPRVWSPSDLLSPRVKVLRQEYFSFNMALSRCFTQEEAKQWQILETEWEKELKFLDSVGVGNTGATPGHLIPNYKKVIEMGFRGIGKEIQRELDKEKDPENNFEGFERFRQASRLKGPKLQLAC